MSGAKAGGDRRLQHCTYCRNHGQAIHKSRHICQFLDCECLLCQLTSKFQAVMRYQQSFWRHQIKQLANHRDPIMRSLYRKQNQLCDKCRNHDDFVNKRGHKNNCPYEFCVCVFCQLTNKRRLVAKFHQMMRRANITAMEVPEDDGDISSEDELLTETNIDVSCIDTLSITEESCETIMVNIVKKLSDLLTMLPSTFEKSKQRKPALKRKMALSGILNVNQSKTTVSSQFPKLDSSMDSRNFTSYSQFTTTEDTTKTDCLPIMEVAEEDVPTQRFDTHLSLDDSYSRRLSVKSPNDANPSTRRSSDFMLLNSPQVFSQNTSSDYPHGISTANARTQEQLNASYSERKYFHNYSASTQENPTLPEKSWRDMNASSNYRGEIYAPILDSLLYYHQWALQREKAEHEINSRFLNYYQTCTSVNQNPSSASSTDFQRFTSFAENFQRNDFQQASTISNFASLGGSLDMKGAFSVVNVHDTKTHQQ